MTHVKCMVLYVVFYTISLIHAFHFKHIGQFVVDPRKISSSGFKNYSKTRPEDSDLSCYLDEDNNWMCIRDIWNVDPEDSY
jgi:hypothetical protein